MNNPVYFHVGYPKAASTSLQINLFDPHSQINHFSKANDNNINLYRILKSKKEISNQEIIADIKFQLSENKPNLFSDESLVNQFYDHASNMTIAHRIKSVFPSSKIIIVIRNQINLLISRYDYSPTHKSINHFLEYCFKYNKNDFLYSLDFYSIFRLYSNLFGNSNVKILLFEDLQNNPNLFCQEFSEFMGISKEETLNCIKTDNKYKTHYTKENSYKRLRAKMFPNIALSEYIPTPITNIIKQLIYTIFKYYKIPKSSIDTKNLDKITAFYSESNLKLQQVTGLDLAKYNYPLRN